MATVKKADPAEPEIEIANPVNDLLPDEDPEYGESGSGAAGDEERIADGDIFSFDDDSEEREALPPSPDGDSSSRDGERLPKVSAARDNLHLYLREISRFPMLTPEEEYDLASRSRRSGDPEAAFKLVSSHLRLVVR
ncbi:MAG: RNA polymerase subunit sigma-70, partial [Desulfovibrio sp.]|nr:RNA polymerase subunit sigma-70 [Desulfovibrio sp.]